VGPPGRVIVLQSNATEIVESVIEAGERQDYGALITLVHEHFFFKTSDRRIYIGHRGISDWIRDFARTYSGREFFVGSVRELDNGFVLMRALERRTPLRGEDEVIPGAWLFHVADGKLTSSIYYRTESEAIHAVSGPARGASPIAVIDRNLASYNHRDFADIVSLMRPDIRFSSSATSGDVQEGIEALARLLAGFEDDGLSVLVESHELTDLGDCFVLVEAVVRVDDEDNELLERFDAIYLARVEGGQIAEWIAYDDVESARAAAEQRIAAQP
jgi:hypothetical protein